MRLFDADKLSHEIKKHLSSVIYRGVGLITSTKDIANHYEFLRGYEEGAKHIANIVLQRDNLIDVWIPVSEKLPNDGEYVLVLDEGMCFAELGTYHEGQSRHEQHWLIDGCVQPITDFRYWMRVPKPPNKRNRYVEDSKTATVSHGRARWIDTEVELEPEHGVVPIGTIEKRTVCSACGFFTWGERRKKTRFCPGCGTEMDGADE